VSVKLELLPEQELLLLHAVEGLEYEFSVGRLYPITLAIVKAYGLDLDGPGYEKSPRRLLLEELVDEYKRQIDYSKTAYLAWDHASLNTRSAHLLALLCALSQESLTSRDGVLYHRGYSAGEEACFCMASFGLLEDGEGGHFTSKGKELATVALSDEFSPLSDFTFEDLQ